MDYKIRKAKKEDAKALFDIDEAFDKELYKQYKSHSKLKGYSILRKRLIKNKKKALEEQAKWIKDNNVFVAELNGRVIGYIAGKIFDRDEKALDKMGYISDLFVEPGYRNKGVASSLLKKLINYFKKKGIAYVSLHVDVPNKYAVEWYKRKGFVNDNLGLVKKI